MMKANLYKTICLLGISGYVWRLKPNSLTRGRPPHPPRPLLPRPKPRWRRGAKRLGGAGLKREGSSRISTGDPLPLRLCALASLRSFLPAAPGSLREIHDVRARRPKLLCTNRAWAVPRIIVRATAALLKFALLTKTKGQKPSSTGEMHSVTAKHKPNAGLVQGSFTVAGLLGLVTQSYIVFGVALLVLLAISLHYRSIRL